MVQRHCKVQVVVCQKDSLLLLQTNAKRGGFWQNVTGSVEAAEEWEAASARELLEETGLHINPKNLIDLKLLWHFTDRWGRDVEERAFLAQIIQNPIDIKLSHEHQHYQWLPLTHSDWSLIKFESNRQAIAESLLKLRSS